MEVDLKTVSELTYTEAYKRLEKITEQIEDGNIPLEDLAAKVKEANELYAICENKLRDIEKEVNEAKK
jgi:exodeoxyribonuclease VII small subunit